eukprot:TRINITY_DN25393_c0_g1_i1.p1 TRINITY_DN25393_c0_g1~~TRINITY_DN25393_c0_g1_i1.p1  ORF type:complete len:246 (+),score=86.04 TRINITY_DN25393_c0_g1_i1:117-854(+)
MRPMSAYREYQKEVVLRPRSAVTASSHDGTRKKSGVRAPPPVKQLRTEEDVDAHISRLYTRPLEMRRKREKEYADAVETSRCQNAVRTAKPAKQDDEQSPAELQRIDKLYYTPVKNRQKARLQLAKNYDGKLEWLQKKKELKKNDIELKEIYGRLFGSVEKRAAERAKVEKKHYPRSTPALLSKDDEAKLVQRQYNQSVTDRSDMMQSATDKHAFQSKAPRKVVNLRRPSVKKRMEEMSVPKVAA